MHDESTDMSLVNGLQTVRFPLISVLKRAGLQISKKARLGTLPPMPPSEVTNTSLVIGV